MKKLLCLIIPAIFLSNFAWGQILLSAYSESYPTGATDNPSSFGLITAIPEINNAFDSAYPNETLRSTLAKDTSFQNTRPKNFVAIRTYDTAKAQFFLHGVTLKNAGDYEYRVMNWNGKTIEPWNPVNKFTDKLFSTTSGWPQMAYLGGFAGTLGDWIVVDVRQKGHKLISSSAVVAWTDIKPELRAIYTASQLDIFLARLARPWSYKLTPEEVYYWHSRYADKELDQQTGLPKKFIGEPADNNLVFYLNAELYHKEQLEYEVIKNDKVITPWKVNDFDNGFIWLRELKPGDYLLKMRYTAQRQHVTDYPFAIKTPWYQSLIFKITIGVLLCGFGGFILFILVHIKQKREAELEFSKKTRLQLELKSIYAQLNPHFIFNALSSIQGLINKQDIAAANVYLSDFAKLMRDTLNNSNSDQISLKQELATLDTYLKLEQLRFGFRYQIDVDEQIGVYETDIPALLLQPLVENAVKHGVSHLNENGAVTLSFNKQGNNMVVTLSDNGKGFSPAKITTGFGLKLTTDRIKLFNDIDSGQPIIMEIKANSPTGAKIVLTFNNWFL